MPCPPALPLGFLDGGVNDGQRMLCCDAVQVLETCMKNCGHMFREKLPFSDLWEELHKVAILKRKVRVQRAASRTVEEGTGGAREAQDGRMK